jgi:hypothetical protein
MVNHLLFIMKMHFVVVGYNCYVAFISSFFSGTLQLFECVINFLIASGAL